MGRPRLLLPPRCPEHPKSIVYLSGVEPQWTTFYERRRWRCYPDGKFKGCDSHTLYVGDERMRHPTKFLPDSGTECVTCEKEYALPEGPKVGKGFMLTAEEGAKLTMSVSEGYSMRESAKRTREAAKRYRFDPDQNDWERDKSGKIIRLRTAGPNRRRVPDQYSREGNLALDYLDIFGPPLIAEFAERRWPAVLVIDLLPLRKRRFAPGQRVSGGEEAGVIMAIADRTTKEKTHLILLQLMGGRNAAEMIRVFTRPDFDPDSAPIWIVADKEPALEVAVKAVWPNAVFFNCEQHLRMNAAEAAVADGIPVWKLDDNAPPGAIAIVGAELEITGHRDDHKVAVDESTKNYVRHPLHVAIRHMFDSLMAWDNFKSRVQADVPFDKIELRVWVAANEALVLRQLELAISNRGMPLANGGVEDDIKWVGKRLEYRARWFRNARRVQIMLDLMTLHRAGRADLLRYTRVIRETMLAQGGGSGYAREDRQRFRDRTGSSIAAMIARSDIESGSDRKGGQNNGRNERIVAQAAAEEAERAAANEASPRGRKRRPDGGAGRVARVSRRGKMVSDFTDIAAQWDYEYNGPRRPETTRAISKDALGWICDAHSKDKIPHLHRWTAQPESRTRINSGCPYCMNREVCTSNCLGAHYPKTRKEWDYTANGDMTPETVMPGKDDYAMWLCLRPKSGHPPYPQEIGAHVKQFQGCPKCGPVVAATKREATAKRKQADALARAEAIRARLEERDLHASEEMAKTRDWLTKMGGSKVEQRTMIVPNLAKVILGPDNQPIVLTDVDVDALPALITPVDRVLPIAEIEEDSLF
jgi:hypothetical protein